MKLQLLWMSTTAVSFFLTLFLTKNWIKIAQKAGLVGKDMNKFDKREIAEAGGITVILGFCFAILLYVFLKTFYLYTESHLIEVFAILASMLLACFLGFVDDILGWKKGIRQLHKVILTIPIAIPLMVININYSTMDLPLIGVVDFGLIYPLLIVPFGIIGATNGFNMLAGFNGLEAGLGSIILATLGIVSFKMGDIWLSLIAFCAVAALLAFLLFNKYPARVFPGDSLTYGIGALIAIIAILGNMEKIAFMLFLPWFAELFLKVRSKFKAENFGIPQKDGTLKVPYKKIYSLTHLIMKVGKFREWQITLILISLVAVWCSLVFLFI